MQRRDLLAVMLAAAVAPPYVRAGSLMRLNPKLIVPSTEIEVVIELVDFDGFNFFPREATFEEIVWINQSRSKTGRGRPTFTKYAMDELLDRIDRDVSKARFNFQYET